MFRNASINLKTNINHVYNQDSFRKSSNQMGSHQTEMRKEQFELILEQSIIDYEHLKRVSWQGVPESKEGGDGCKD